jgi:drug/metabolite transporter (DMT)-like permease
LVEAPVVIVAPIVAVYPLVTITLTAIFLRNIEKVTLRTISGAALVVTGVILVGIGTA